MKSKLFKFALIVLTVGILSACGSQPTEAPASVPTTAVVPATQAADSPTSAPATEAPTTAASGGSTVSFAQDVLPLLESRCVSCHGGDRTSEGLSMKSYADLMNGSNNGPVISANDATNSLLIQMVSSGKMPKRGPKLTPDQVQLVTDWVNQGAQNN
jgi:mono/diheme cytochrome c family protein